jgi:hypothetical protein
LAISAIHDGIAEADRGEFASSAEVSAVFAKYTSVMALSLTGTALKSSQKLPATQEMSCPRGLFMPSFKPAQSGWCRSWDGKAAGARHAGARVAIKKYMA